MEQDLITILETKVDGLLARIAKLEEEKRILEKELGEMKDHINALEAQKEAALLKIRSILDKIDTLSQGPSNSIGNESSENLDDSGSSRPEVSSNKGDKSLF